MRYLKIIINAKMIIVFCISAIISNSYLLYINYTYIEFYKKTPNIMSVEAVIVGEREEKEYSYRYIIKVKKGVYKNKKFILTAKKDEKNILKYGDLIKIKEGEYIAPSEKRNYKGFNYREYLKTKKVFGTIKVDSNKIQKLEEKKLNKILIISNDVRKSIIENAQKLLPDKKSKLLVGILLGNKSGIPEQIIEDFKKSNLSHMLSVSGAHTSYVILGVSYILNKSKISKKYIHIFTIITLILFMFITNFTNSVIRACLMGILVIGAKLFYRKVDFINSISIALLITLIYNPFVINEIGLQLSYLGTIGIILFNKNITKLFTMAKFNIKISEILSVTFSAQTMIMPIMALKFNNLSFTFFISNILATPFLGITMILGFATIFISFISYSIAKMLAVLLNITLECLINISHFTSKIPFSKILIKTPYTFTIIFIYILVLLFNYVFTLYKLHKSNTSLRLFQRKILKLMSLKSLIIILKIISIATILYVIFSSCYSLIFPNLEIYFIDVGQGDSTLIITPNNKKVLIDGGEGDTSVLIDYLLDRRIKTIDYIIISHFDSDHCNGLVEVIEELNVKNIIISKQAHKSEEYTNIAKIIIKKKINVIYAKQGDSLQIDKDLKVDILYPTYEFEYDDLNNNSIVAKVSYNDFSILFTRRYRKIRRKYYK